MSGRCIRNLARNGHNSFIVRVQMYFLKLSINEVKSSPLEYMRFSSHAGDGASLSGLHHSFSWIASNAASTACNNESRQHFSLPCINNRISYHPHFSAEEFNHNKLLSTVPLGFRVQVLGVTLFPSRLFAALQNKEKRKVQSTKCSWRQSYTSSLHPCQ